MMPLIILLLVVMVVVAYKVLTGKLVGKISLWKQQAEARGYELDLTHRAPPAGPFDLLTAVTDRKVWTTVTRPGSNDSAFFYKFDVRHENDEQKFRRTCAMIELPFSAPKTTLRPRSLQTAPARPTDGDDLVLGFGQFDDVFRLQVSNEEFAQALFTPGFAEWLATPDAKVGDVEFEFRNHQLFCSAPMAETIDELIDMFEWAQAVRDRAHAALGHARPA